MLRSVPNLATFVTFSRKRILHSIAILDIASISLLIALAVSCLVPLFSTLVTLPFKLPPAVSSAGRRERQMLLISIASLQRPLGVNRFLPTFCALAASCAQGVSRR